MDKSITISDPCGCITFVFMEAVVSGEIGVFPISCVLKEIVFLHMYRQKIKGERVVWNQTVNNTVIW